MDSSRTSIFLSAICFFLLIVHAVTLKPNIILIVTDDQDVVLKGMTPMKNTQTLLANKGATFTNAFTSSPICCPSRASILSGQYAHNHATINNSRSGGCDGQFWQDHIEKRAIPTFLYDAGYTTFFSGKYLNEYNSNRVPPGWNEWYGLHGNSVYYNFTLTENGIIKKYFQDEYLTDIIKNKSVEFLNTIEDENPFFMMISPPAPHAPFTSADRHNTSFPDVNAIKTKNFNVVSGPLDKHWLLTMPPAPLPEEVLSELDNIARKRWQSLLAVDELVESVVATLEERNFLNNTYIIYTSDNGYHIGQFAQAYDKRQPYETDIRVPFVVKGPQIKSKTMINSPTALIDILPTILDWAEIPVPHYLDGVSINRNLNNSAAKECNPLKIEKRQILIEYWGEGSAASYNPECPWQKKDKLFGCTLDAACHCQDSWNNTYSCIRQITTYTDFLYCEFWDREQFVEAYDLNDDQYQMANIGFDMLPSEHAIYSLSLQNLTRCTGKSCKQTHLIWN